MRWGVDERFWNRIEVHPLGCWLWTGYREPAGYGRFQVDGRSVRAHRVAWSLENGPIPEAKHVLHRCDVPACVNPAHLYLGTHQDNMRDRDSRGRQRAPAGRAHRRSSAKLTELQVRSIRLALHEGWEGQAVAKAFGVSNSAICDIHRRRTWRHL